MKTRDSSDGGNHISNDISQDLQQCLINMKSIFVDMYNNFDDHFLNQSKKGQGNVCLHCLECNYSVIQLQKNKMLHDTHKIRWYGTGS